MNRSIIRVSTGLFVTAVALTSSTLTEASEDKDKLTLDRVAFNPPSAKPGETITLEVVVTPEKGWHIYGSAEDIGLPPSLSLDKNSFARQLNRTGGFQVPKGSGHESFGMTSYWLEGEQTLKQTFTVREDAPTGEFTLSGALEFMVCDRSMCLPPDSIDLSATLAIREGNAPTPPNPIAPDHHVIVNDDYDKAVRIAKESDKVLLVNFTGHTCVNCRLMEDKWFVRKPISTTLAGGFVEARLHIDGVEHVARIKELQERLVGSVGVPSYVIVDPDTGKKHGRYDRGPCLNDEDAQGFAKFLDNGKKAVAKASAAKKRGR